MQGTKYDNKSHPKVREQSPHFIDNVYSSLKQTEINIEYNGGVKFHRQYNRVIKQLQTLSGSKKSYGARLFLYMVNLAKSRNNVGFKVSLDKHLFKDKGKDDVSFQSWIDMLQVAVNEGYGALYIGDSTNEEGICKQYVSVFQLSDKAFTLLDGMNEDKAPNTKIKTLRNSVSTTIKHSKVWEEEVPAKGKKIQQGRLNELNTHLLDFTFKNHLGVIVDPQMGRKFSLYSNEKKNNGLTMFDSYGRYVNAFQSMRQPQRKDITINDLPVCEGDYSSNHAFIAYELEGIRPEQAHGEFKPYMIPDCDSPIKGTQEAKRAVYKLAMMMMFNSGNPGKSLFNEIDKIFTKLDNYLPSEIVGDKALVFKDLHRQPTETECHDIVRQLRKKNHKIEKYFDGKSAALLQNYDSRIAEQVMLYLKAHGLPYICIHDSFITFSSAWKALVDAMFYGWREVLGSDMNCKVDFKYGKPAPTEDLEEREDYDLWMETTTEQERRLFVNGAVQHFFDWEQLAGVWRQSGRELTPLMINNRDNLPIPF
ncbi:TPA: hypothetical protein RG682_002276 [Vibrio alginolyticus]|uniref:hypothetical protein n=1 Tax=Vibrio sp. YT-19(2023) TaxID=3074710 RepID=UPI00280EE0E2|nr:hypothetical protein [Vibrio sp. YT-19(2023)]MDW1500501.1 hypothetical protein [Vibrio sp. YT-19(2023)]HDU8586796.1 hypothetical protein [Vibrio alginolyticus]